MHKGGSQSVSATLPRNDVVAAAAAAAVCLSVCLSAPIASSSVSSIIFILLLLLLLPERTWKRLSIGSYTYVCSLQERVEYFFPERNYNPRPAARARSLSVCLSVRPSVLSALGKKNLVARRIAATGAAIAVKAAAAAGAVRTPSSFSLSHKINS